eukprot:scpid35732/ scgid4444/ Capon-like protein
MSLKRTKTRPNKRQYEDLDDSRDTRVPLHNDEAFMHGLSFTAKFIGSLEVSKPSSRVEIVSCMRRIRYEFRAKSMKKAKATINVSVSGVKVTKYVKKKRKRQRKRTPEDLVANPQVILESPIYRIFYVSHDSLDKKIFSFIARVEAAGNRKTFVCAVFKAYKKSHALRIVRTIGQAFDICCKLQQSTDAVNIPGLLPPEKLKKLKEKKDGDEGTSVDDTDGEPTRRERLSTSPGDMLNNFNLDMSVVEATELPPNAIVTMEDDYETNLLEYQKHLYAFGQSLLLNSADVQQSTNEEALLDGYKLSPAQRQLMILQFKLKQEQGLASAFMPAGSTQANVSSNGADAVLSKPLPTPPPNRLKVGSKGKFARPGVGVTENTNRDDSALLPRVAEEGAAAAAAGTPSAAAAAEATAATTSSVNNVDVRSMQSYQLVTQQEGKVTVKSIRDKRRELRQVKSPFTTRLPKLPQDTVLNRSPLPTQDKDPSPHSTRGSGSEKDEQRTSDHSMADLLAMEDGKAWSLTTQGKLTDQRHQQEAKARQRNEMVQRNKMRPKHQKKDSSGSSDTSVHPSGRKKPDAPRRKPPAKKLANRPVRDTAHKRKVLFPKITQPPKKAWTQQSEKHSKHRLVLPNIHAAKDSSTGSSISSGHSSVHTSTHGNTGSSSSGF